MNITGVETGEQLQLTAQSQSVNVTGLTPYTTYFCIVAASTAIGPGPFSTQIIVRTPEAGINVQHMRYSIVMLEHDLILAGISLY